MGVAGAGPFVRQLRPPKSSDAPKIQESFESTRQAFQHIHVAHKDAQHYSKCPSLSPRPCIHTDIASTVSTRQPCTSIFGVHYGDIITLYAGNISALPSLQASRNTSIRTSPSLQKIYHPSSSLNFSKYSKNMSHSFEVSSPKRRRRL